MTPRLVATRRRQLCGAVAVAMGVALIAAAPVGAALAAPSPPAAGVTPADAKAVRTVIEAQLAAFAADDAERAFALAAPGIRRQFGSADDFIAMVRAGYPAVYRPAAVAFLQAERAGGEVLQRVQLTDAEGRVWIALYRLERQRDRRWRISGCTVTGSEGRFTGVPAVRGAALA